MSIYTEIRPWGKFEKFVQNDKCTVKLIYVNPNSRLSLQYHSSRREFWKIVKGTAEIEIDEKKIILKEGGSTEIPQGARHRIRTLDEECVLLEISYGDFDENDIVRIEDDYQRV